MLETNDDGEDWTCLADRLDASSSHGSARMAAEIAIDKVASFDGERLGRLVVNYDKLNEERNVSLSLGLDYRLFLRMSVDQATEV